MDDDLKDLIRQIGRVVLAHKTVDLVGVLLCTLLALGVGLWALLILRQTFWQYFGL